MVASLIIVPAFLISLALATGGLVVERIESGLEFRAFDGAGRERVDLRVSLEDWPELKLFAASGAQLLGRPE